ncbi:MAG: hypothetical protein AAF571_04590 [Verrucomicrobiota bacterium]
MTTRFHIFSLLLLMVSSLEVGIAAGELPIRLYTPSGWMLEVRPNGSGTLTWQQEPFPSATARPYTFNYIMLMEELKSRPEGDSKYQYLIGTAQTATKISAPKDSPFLLQTLKKAARILYSHDSEDFYKTRIIHPVFPKTTES